MEWDVIIFNHPDQIRLYVSLILVRRGWFARSSMGPSFAANLRRGDVVKLDAKGSREVVLIALKNASGNIPEAFFNNPF